eukprot:m.656838 g.656838  ORF g.656838 m.656838 type:complete len:687 (+) comp22707_c1_seq5:358-2418(+)
MVTRVPQADSRSCLSKFVKRKESNFSLLQQIPDFRIERHTCASETILLKQESQLSTCMIKSDVERSGTPRARYPCVNFPLMSAEERSHLVGKTLLGNQHPIVSSQSQPLTQEQDTPTVGPAVGAATKQSRKTVAEDACLNAVQKRRCLSSQHLDDSAGVSEDIARFGSLSSDGSNSSGSSGSTLSHTSETTTKTLSPETPAVSLSVGTVHTNNADPAACDATVTQEAAKTSDADATKGTEGPGTSTDDDTASDDMEVSRRAPEAAIAGTEKHSTERADARTDNDDTLAKQGVAKRDEEAALAMFAMHRHAYGYTATPSPIPRSGGAPVTSVGDTVPTTTHRTLPVRGVHPEHGVNSGIPQSSVADGASRRQDSSSSSTVVDDRGSDNTRSEDEGDDATDDDDNTTAPRPNTVPAQAHLVRPSQTHPQPVQTHPRPVQTHPPPAPTHLSPHAPMMGFPSGVHPHPPQPPRTIATVGGGYQLVRPGMAPGFMPQHPMNLVSMQPTPGAMYVPSTNGHVLPNSMQFINHMQQMQQMQMMNQHMHPLQLAHDPMAMQHRPPEFWAAVSAAHVAAAGQDISYRHVGAQGHPRAVGRTVGVEKACICCRTTTTPLWRDIPQDGACPGQPLCNACGIRYTKYGLLCTNCFYVPNKQQRQHTQCPRCSETLPPPRKKPTPTQPKSTPTTTTGSS